ncbi:hypothetical protein [Luteolibacter marinus]|uniref:hypothetical protein n=1 Tax=Luteolibacter marinus TaxID=2776705 RepID=UPI0018682003|nr:hypothetical protein [Luteolibacter marinus]
MLRYLSYFTLTLPAAAALTNGGFEATPFLSAWNATGVVATSGLNGSANAARLPYNTTAKLGQAFAATPDFTFDAYLAVAGVTTDPSFHLVLDGNGGPAVDLQGALGNQLQLLHNGTVTPLQSIADGSPFGFGTNQVIRFRIIGRNFGTPAASYDLAWSEPGSTALVHAATGLTSFASAAAATTGSGITGVRFDRLGAAAHSYWVDDISLTATPATAPAADYTLVPPLPDKVVNISGVYPHLAMTNTHAECGIGAVVPWAGKLWAITYGPHIANGGTDKLYEIDQDLNLTVRAESVGGTPANRFIHAATNQLNIGPYFIDADRNVRVLKTAGTNNVLPGRFTASAAHLDDPNRLYLFTMEDGLYDVDATDLSYIVRYPDVQGTGDGFLSGYHGKGAYTSQGRLVVGNNGEPNQTLPSGVLATWDGSLRGAGNANPDYMTAWNEIERIQTCEVTGPGGIHGNPDPATDPVWTTGFDPKSVVVHTLENQQWHTWRLPKASYTHDGAHGWHTEWPRIRQLDPGDPGSLYLMHMHGQFFDFPKTFSAANFAGLRPLSTYYKMPTDYCWFDGRIVMGRDDASQFDNAFALKDQSNLWFGDMETLEHAWGPPTGHGALWLNQAVGAGEISAPFLIGGYPQGTLHLRNLGAAATEVSIEVSNGTPEWSFVRSVTLPAGAYVPHPVGDLAAPWVRLVSSAATTNLTAFFHLSSPYPHTTPASIAGDEFAALADIRDTRSVSDGIIRVMNHPRLELEFASSRLSASGVASSHGYHRIGGPMLLADAADSTAEAALRGNAALAQEFGSDAASAWVTEGGVKFRLPKTDPLYDAPFAAGWARGIREAVTERELLNCHGTFYEVPRDISGGMRKMRALVTHGKRITDFASWRGLLVLTGVLDDAPASDKLVKNPDGSAALWLGEIDDLWRMGEARGSGGPWQDTVVAAGIPSDPYLMYGYDHKELTLTASDATTVTVEVDFLADDSWSTYQTFDLAAGETVHHVFPTGFHAHWVRVKSSAATTATARFTYGPADRRDAFLDWARDHGLPTAAGRHAVMAANPDGDPLDNLAEYLFGTDPGHPDAWPLATTRSGVSAVLRDLDPADGIHFDFTTSIDLEDWTDGSASVAADPDQAGVPTEFTRYRFPFDPDLDPKRFVRIEIGL